MRVIIVDDEVKALQLFLSQIVDINLEYRFFKDDKAAILDFVRKNETSVQADYPVHQTYRYPYIGKNTGTHSHIL